MELSELYAAGPSDDPQKLITLQYLIDNPQGGGGGGGGLAGTSYVFVQGNGTPGDNATELNLAKASAIAKVPSISNRITVVIAPGIYTFGATKFVVDTPYLDYVSLTGNPDVLIDGIEVNANNVYIKGFSSTSSTFVVEENLDKTVIENCVGGDFSFNPSIAPGTIKSTFINCKAGNDSFCGEGYYIEATLYNCESKVPTGTENTSFGAGGGGNGLGASKLYYCRMNGGEFDSVSSLLVACTDNTGIRITGYTPAT